MPDLFDRAQELEARQRQAALDACLARAAPAAGNAVTDCTDCGDAIPPARKRANPAATRCVSCQTDQDNKASQ